jgi:glycosyltransferase involved in cell wall biosynthesis
VSFNPKVSIIIPVYNGSNYMREAIDSALSQTYKNIEILVINDGSNDNGATREIALSYGDRIKYFKKENGGVASALNLGIEKMTGEYFSWLSHDDVYYQNKIEKQVSAMSDHNTSEIILYSDYAIMNSKSEIVGSTCFHKSHLVSRLNASYYPLFFGLIHGCTLLIPKNLFDKFGVFNEKLKTTQDYDLWFRIFKNINVLYIPDILIKSRVHDKQESKRNVNDVHRLEGNSLWINMMENISDEQVLAFQDTKIKFYKDIMKVLKDTMFNDAYEYAKDSYNKLVSRINMENIKVSVIIPFYNRILSVQEAIESVLKQTHQNIEIILIDDGSTEDMGQYKKKWEQISNVRYCKQENKGPAAARNLGVLKASGDYIAFLDSDDTFLPDKIEIQLHEMCINGDLFSHTSYNRIDNTTKSIIHSGLFDGYVFPAIILGCPIATPTVMMSSSIVKEGLMFPNNINSGEDICFWISVAARFKVRGIDSPLTNVNIGSENTWNDYNKRIIGINNIINYVLADNNYKNHKREIADLYKCLANTYTEMSISEMSINEMSANENTTIENAQIDQFLDLVRRLTQNKYSSFLAKFLILRIMYPFIKLSYNCYRIFSRGI